MRQKQGAKLDQEMKRFGLRLPIALFVAISALAQRNRRSMNAEITIAIEQYISVHTQQ